jgi:transposase
MKHIVPVQRGNISIVNHTFLHALLHICENGYKWRRLPKEYGNWHVMYQRFHRWVHMGMIGSLFKQLHVIGSNHQNEFVRFFDSMSVPVHPDACGVLKKRRTSHRKI